MEVGTRHLAQAGEEDLDLALGGLGRVGAMNEVLRHLQRQVPSYRTRGGVDRVRGPHQRPDDPPVVPGEAATGFVSLINVLSTRQTSVGPCTTMTREGERPMNPTSSS